MNKQLRRKQKGQTMMLLAGAVLALLALVALAVDGGNAYNQRRVAQNAADAAATTGIARLNQLFQSKRHTTTTTVDNITGVENVALGNEIRSVLVADGIKTTDYTAYFVKPDGTRYSQGTLGANESVPFYGATSPNSPGVAGIWVGATARNETYFARVIGINQVSADAKSGAILGGASKVTKANAAVPIWPIIIKADTIANPQANTTLYDFDNSFTGNWGVVCYNGDNCGNNDVKDWYLNGFDPSTGMTLASTYGGNSYVKNFFPIGNDGGVSNTHGFWLNTKTGNMTSASCDVIKDYAENHRHVYIPIGDEDPATNTWHNGNGSNVRYFVRNIAEFEIVGATCPGSSNNIQGRFVSFGFRPGQTDWTGNLGDAIEWGNTVVNRFP